MQSASKVVGANVRRIRRGKEWSVAELAARCVRVGGEELTHGAITNIELGRRNRTVTVDELLILAEALSVIPAALLPALAPVGTPPASGAALEVDGWTVVQGGGGRVVRLRGTLTASEVDTSPEGQDLASFQSQPLTDVP